MGRKSREKKERRRARMTAESGDSPTESLTRGRAAFEAEQESRFQSDVEAMNSLLQQYEYGDAAIALCVSELWPANAGSYVKHILTWRLLLGLQDEEHRGMAIRTYEEFKGFVETLYATWPEFPMLEDFSPEADWGQVKVRLGGDFVPMFYGSFLERTPDFIEAFRITYADNPKAQAHIDLVLALQAQIIRSIRCLRDAEVRHFQDGHVELPPEEFWVACRSTVLSLENKLSDRREVAGFELETELGSFKTPVTWNAFGEAAIRGNALPHLAVRTEVAWVPMSVRGAPGCVMGHWGTEAEGFHDVVVGPLAAFIGDESFEDLPVSCIVSTTSGLYLICACSHSSRENASKAATRFYSKVGNSEPVRFFLESGHGITLEKEAGSSPRVDDLRVVMVLTLGSVANAFVELPERPARLLPLADFITIFDSIKDLDELEAFWSFSDSNHASLSPFSLALADLYASFKDADALLVEGAESPTQVVLDPQWGTAWRFQRLAEFWSLAPRVFPDGSTGWRASAGTEGVVELQSRNKRQIVYSTTVGFCTIQTMIRLTGDFNVEDSHMVNLIAQIIADCSYRCRNDLANIPLLQRHHLLLICDPDPSYPISLNDTPKRRNQLGQLVTFQRASFTLDLMLRRFFLGSMNPRMLHLRCAPL